MSPLRCIRGMISTHLKFAAFRSGSKPAQSVAPRGFLVFPVGEQPALYISMTTFSACVCAPRPNVS
jgi:hypothetical protein